MVRQGDCKPSVGGGPRIGVLGDSISAGYNRWPYNVPGTILNHAVAGQDVVNNMDAQTVAAASDSAEIIIIALGTNDDGSAGNMAALQAEYEENVAELKVSNAGATIYAMNVLPRWTDVGGGTPVDRSSIRTAIAAACTSQGITCWDTFTTPWIAANETLDGLHPNVVGSAKIAAQVIARL